MHLGEGHTLDLGRVVKHSEFTDEHGNIEIDFELLTEKNVISLLVTLL
jgi:hypothetical protein